MKLNRTAILIAFPAMALLLPQRAGAELSAEQYDIEGRAVQRQIADLLKLRPCLRPEDRRVLLDGAHRWLGGSARYPANPAVRARETEMRQMVASLDSAPACGAPSIETAVSPAPVGPAARNAADAASSNEALVGALAGRQAKIEHATVLGFAAAYQMRDSADAVAIGRSAAEAMSNSPSTIALGDSAGRFAEKSQYATIIGAVAGYKMKEFR